MSLVSSLFITNPETSGKVLGTRWSGIGIAFLSAPAGLLVSSFHPHEKFAQLYELN
jgi:hypothetical protein